MLGPPVSPERHWNTWDSAHPASLVHLPSRLSLRLAAFSGERGPLLRLPHRAAARAHGRRELRRRRGRAGGLARPARARQGRPVLARRAADRAGDGRVGAALLAAARARLPRRGRGGPEHRPDPCPPRPARRPVHAARARARPPPQPPRLPRARPSARPTRASTTTSPSCARSSRQGGYYRPHPEQPDGRWAVLRFNGQSQASTRFALAEATDDAAAERRARALLPEVEALIDARAAEARRGSEPARAVRDVVAWNTTLRRREPALVHAPDPQLDAVEVRRLGRVARRRALPRAARRRGRRRADRARQPRGRADRPAAGGQPRLPADRLHRVGRPLAAADRRLRRPARLPPHRRPRAARAGLPDAAPRPRLVVRAPRRQRQRRARARLLPHRRGHVRAHQAGRDGRGGDGQPAAVRRRRLRRARAHARPRGGRPQLARRARRADAQPHRDAARPPPTRPRR